MLIGVLVGAAIGVIVGAGGAAALRHRTDTAARRRGTSRAGLFEAVINDSPTGIAVVDAEREIVLHNRRAEEFTLVRDDRLDDRGRAAARKALRDSRPVDFDLVPEDGDRGRSMSVRGQARPLDAGTRRYAVLFVDDDSEIVRVESARRDFVANVSHELKTPVGAMGLLAEALLESADDPEIVRHFGEKVLSESSRLGAMVTELIALSRLQGAEKLPNLEVVRVDEVVAEALGNAALTAATNDTEITTDEDSGLEVLGDRMLLITALTNLISNAVNYSPQGTPVAVRRELRRGMVQISVTDRGIGIAPKYQQRVFERFYRVDKARSRATGGTGLGLAIVKHVAINHNGRIRLWSRQGEGSTFTLEIPVHRSGDPAVTPKTPPADGAHRAPQTGAPDRKDDRR